MKKVLLSCSIILSGILGASAQIVVEDNEVIEPMTYEKGLRFCEGTTPYRNMILVSNFGTHTLNPLNNEKSGYIMSLGLDGVRKKLIPTDGNLSAPKGMMVVKSHLYIADVGKIVVYNLNKPEARPQIVMFPEEDRFVNDIVNLSDMILVSVTDTGRIYGINAQDPDNVGGQTPKLLGKVPGANGMVVNGSTLYVASYNPSGKPDDDNVIYAYEIYAQKSSMKKLIPGLAPGQYDGMAISEDGATLYFTSWGDGSTLTKPAVYAYDLDGKSNVKVLDFGVELQGPADISIKGGYIWIPDLPASKVYRFPLK